MNTHRALALLAALLCCLALAGLASAQGLAGYDLPWYVTSNGGGETSSPHYTLNATVGQGVAGASSSASYRLGGGFWYAYGIPEQAEYEIYLPLVLRGHR